MSRDPFKPKPDQRKQVEAMAGYGVPEEAIARVVQIDPKTLRKYFREELDTAHTKANSAVAQSLYQKAVGNGPQAVTAAIFWAKTRMGWREPPVVLEHGGKDGGPIQTQETPPTDQKRARAVAALIAKPRNADPENDQ